MNTLQIVHESGLNLGIQHLDDESDAQDILRGFTQATIHCVMTSGDGDCDVYVPRHELLGKSSEDIIELPNGQKALLVSRGDSADASYDIKQALARPGIPANAPAHIRTSAKSFSRVNVNLHLSLLETGSILRNKEVT